ncbi:MAG: riboflavin synthase [Spirochaetales bacterium]|nr:riboflavin synthase [Spirochaetales bacterium]MCF7938930.1 riboflavin synthase [Spirochaetales bacterium]
MFTGLIEEIGTVGRLNRRGAYQHLTIHAQRVLDDMKTGDSIAINGACQTVAGLDDNSFSVETLAVTLEKTSLGLLKKGAHVNLERALRMDSRLGGHFVQGHVDGKGRISSIRRASENIFLEVILPQELMRFCAAQGSIAIEGVSLTIADLRGVRIMVNIIPTTRQSTVLKDRKAGDPVNIEIDMMARYAARLKGVDYE